MLVLAQALRTEDTAAQLAAIDGLHSIVSSIEERSFSADTVELDQGRAYAQASELLARLPDDLRPPEIEPRAQLENACALAERVGDHELQCFSALKLGELLRDQGALLEARSVLQDALEQLERAHGSRVGAQLVLAQIARSRGALTVAEERIEDAEHTLERIAPLFGETDQAARFVGTLRCNILGLKSEVALALGLPDQAIRVAGEARELADELGSTEIRALAALRQARVYLATERYTALRRVVNAALQLEGLDARQRTLLVLHRARAEAEAARLDEDSSEVAEASLREVLDAPSLSTADRLQPEAVLAELLMRQGRQDEAAKHLSAARDLVHVLEEGEQEGAGNLEQALYVASLESRLAVLAQAEPEELEARLADLNAAFERFLSQWANTPVRAGGVAFLQYQSRRLLISELLRLTLLVEGEAGAETALFALQRAQALGSMARSADYTSRPLSELRRHLTGATTGVLVYLPGPDRTHVFALDETHLIYAELTPAHAHREALRTFVDLVSLPPSKEAGAAGRSTVLASRASADVFAWLLPSAIRSLVARWSAVSIVGADLFGYVPFEFLPAGQGRLLGDALALSYLPSLPVGVLLGERIRQNGPPRTIGVALVAAPRYGDDARARWTQLVDIPFGNDEREALVRPFGKTSIRVLHGQEATLDALRAAAATSTHLLHILTHGVYDPQRERNAGLALAPDEHDSGLLWCDDVEDLDVPPVVIVSACGAGLGPLRRGEDGVGHLGGALLAAGAQAVVLSPGKLHYGGLMRIMPLVHESLAQGAGPAEALRGARAAMANDPDYGHPFFALIHVIGLGGESVFPQAR